MHIKCRQCRREYDNAHQYCPMCGLPHKQNEEVAQDYSSPLQSTIDTMNAVNLAESLVDTPDFSGGGGDFGGGGSSGGGGATGDW